MNGFAQLRPLQGMMSRRPSANTISALLSVSSNAVTIAIDCPPGTYCCSICCTAIGHSPKSAASSSSVKPTFSNASSWTNQ